MVNKYGVVQVVALDFSKAFDTVRHCTLMDKFSQTSMPDNIYNWLVSYFSGRDHCTKYNGVISSAASINASVVQGSALGPLAFLICSSDLRAKTPGNKVLKYADDSYLLVPSCNSNSIPDELMQIGAWADSNNLKLNNSKSQELVVCKKGTDHKSWPPPTPGIQRVQALEVLGVFMQSDLSFSAHIKSAVTKGNQCLYALKTLKAHGMSDGPLFDVQVASLGGAVVRHSLTT